MRIIITATLLIFTILAAKAQISVETSFINATDYEHDESTERGTLNAAKYKASINLPLSRTISDGGKKIRIWTGFVTASYLKLNETSRPQNYGVKDILNSYVGISHYRTLSSRWSLISYAGFGINAGNFHLSSTRWRNIMGFAIAQFVYKVNNNLDLGGGLILTNAFDQPLLLPALYANWHGKGKYSFSLDTRTYDFRSTLTRNFSKTFKLSIACNYERIGTPLLAEQGCDKYFSINYLTATLRPEIYLAKKLALPIDIGIQTAGTTTSKYRRLSQLLKKGDQYTLKTSPYVSIGLRYDM